MKPKYDIPSSMVIYMAEVFATAAHGAIDQRRKYTGAPYIMHPEAVARIVQSVESHTVQMVCAAWLHDVLEDTQCQTPELDRFFGYEVTTMVYRLTDVGPDYGNRAARKAYDRQRLAESSAEVQTIKIADLIDNTATIVKFDPKFAKVYIREKRELLDVLDDADRGLWQRAYNQLVAAELELVKA